MLSARVCLLTPHLLLVLVQLSPAGGHRTTGPRVSASAGNAPTCAGREVFWPLIYRRGKGGDRPCPRLYCLVPCGPLGKVAEIKFHCSSPPPLRLFLQYRLPRPVTSGFSFPNFSRVFSFKIPPQHQAPPRSVGARPWLEQSFPMVSLRWSPCWRSWQAEGVCVCVCVGRITGGGRLLCLESFRLPVSHTRTLCCCCCFKKQSLLVKPTADNFNAPSCRPGPGGVVGVGSCGEVGRAAQYSRISSPWVGSVEPWSDWSF